MVAAYRVTPNKTVVCKLLRKHEKKPEKEQPEREKGKVRGRKEFQKVIHRHACAL